MLHRECISVLLSVNGKADTCLVIMRCSWNENCIDNDRIRIIQGIVSSDSDRTTSPVVVHLHSSGQGIDCSGSVYLRECHIRNHSRANVLVFHQPHTYKRHCVPHHQVGGGHVLCHPGGSVQDVILVRQIKRHIFAVSHRVVVRQICDHLRVPFHRHLAGRVPFFPVKDV